jgi:hypothetical protein
MQPLPLTSSGLPVDCLLASQTLREEQELRRGSRRKETHFEFPQWEWEGRRGSVMGWAPSRRLPPPSSFLLTPPTLEWLLYATAPWNGQAGNWLPSPCPVHGSCSPHDLSKAAGDELAGQLVPKAPPVPLNWPEDLRGSSMPLHHDSGRPGTGFPRPVLFMYPICTTASPRQQRTRLAGQLVTGAPAPTYSPEDVGGSCGDLIPLLTGDSSRPP